ncbi:MinD/ParA family protein [Lentisalinibacter sediminis]|uniref:MinD/ParA family protein n=1 Tax=Lentisalinibacter sediminis TaxID=2992237 RepID=UPI00386FE07D
MRSLEHTQARDMERALAGAPVKVIAVTSGKGGVGKTNVSANLAVALASFQRNVMLLDADLGLANVDVLFGLQPRYNLQHVLSGETDLESTIVRGPRGLSIVPAASGDKAMTDLAPAAQGEIIRAFGDLACPPEVLVIDTAAGLSDNVLRFTQAAQHAVVVVCDEPASITDAYAMIKVLSRDYGVGRFQVLTNMTRSDAHGRLLFQKIERVADRYLDVVLQHLGNVPADDTLRRAVQQQVAVVEAYPASRAALAFRRIADAVDRWPAAAQAPGGLAFFFESLLGRDLTAAGSLTG